MKENKFLRLLRTLDKSERKEFHKYLHGLYGKQEKMLLLFDAIYRDEKKGLRNTIQGENYISKQLFEKPQSVKVVGNLFADLYKYLEEFLRWKKIKSTSSNHYLNDKLRLEIYEERKLNDWFFRQIEKTKEAVKKAPVDIWHHLKLMELSHLAFSNDSTEKASKEMEDLKKSLHHLDLFFLSAKLKYASEVKNRANVLSKSALDIWLLDEILEGYQQFDNTDFFSDTYFNLFRLQHSRSTEDYKKTKEIFLKQLSLFTIDEQTFILSHLLNYNISKARINDATAKDELVELYDLGISSKILLTAAKGIELVQFFNIIIAGCRYINTTWAEDFYIKHVIFLKKEEREDGNLLAQSIIEFEKRQFSNALILLRQLNFGDVFFSLRIRMLKLKCLIELRENVTLISSECLSFEQFIRRDTILNEQTIIAYKNFLSFIRKYFLNPKFDKKELINLIGNYDLFVQRAWIINKVGSKRRFL